MRACRWSTAYSLVVAIAAGCSSPAPQPTTVPAGADTLVIEGAHKLEEGETEALTVRVRLASGAFKAVAEDAPVRWSSADQATATVSDRGVVTALRTGPVRISAAFDSLYAGVDVVVAPGTRAISVYVYPSPDKGSLIPGAGVTIVDARGRTQSVQADGSGYFSIRLPKGPARFSGTASGYEASDLSIDVSYDRTLWLGLLPIGSGVREQFGVPWEEWNGVPIPGAPLREAAFSIVVHQPGTVRMYADACLKSCSASDTQAICAEIRDSRNHVVSSGRGTYDNGLRLPNVQTSGGQQYQVKVGVCSAETGPSLMSRYYIDVTHPK